MLQRSAPACHGRSGPLRALNQPALLVSGENGPTHTVPSEASLTHTVTFTLPEKSAEAL